MLKNSTQDIVNFPLAVEERFIDLCNTWLRVKDQRLLPPKDLSQDMILWRTLMMRYRKRHYQHTTDELNATRRIAEWTHQVHCELTGQEYKSLGLMEYV